MRLALAQLGHPLLKLLVELLGRFAQPSRAEVVDRDLQVPKPPLDVLRRRGGSILLLMLEPFDQLASMLCHSLGLVVATGFLQLSDLLSQRLQVLADWHVPLRYVPMALMCLGDFTHFVTDKLGLDADRFQFGTKDMGLFVLRIVTQFPQFMPNCLGPLAQLAATLGQVA